MLFYIALHNIVKLENVTGVVVDVNLGKGAAQSEKVIHGTLKSTRCVAQHKRNDLGIGTIKM